MRHTIFLASCFVLIMSNGAAAVEIDAVAEAQRIDAGLSRLCGVWDWTVHSHTNHHRESKAKIVLPSAEAAGVVGPAPTEIRIYGDAVYFKWVYPGGYQEDSMLLTDSKRLEGTFRTSSGAVGAVNGKRSTACAGVKAADQKATSEVSPAEGKP